MLIGGKKGDLLDTSRGSFVGFSLFLGITILVLSSTALNKYIDAKKVYSEAEMKAKTFKDCLDTLSSRIVAPNAEEIERCGRITKEVYNANQ